MKKGNGYVNWLEVPLGSDWEKIKNIAEDIREFMIKHSDMEETNPDNNLNYFVTSMIDPYSLYDILHYLKSYNNNQEAKELLNRTVDCMLWRINAFIGR